ncbi:TlyA family RNA methyltransferase [Demequina sp. NBRC 110051]|uniref:TlyA family RNA methyltransferase n=1 Tax=Demequina sp. NBRC 110051 TaxID=1570340 RepID=UPI000A0718FE|nr:TlyA family RNA methyltransferase [Demequina sp. NBRC 110051]
MRLDRALAERALARSRSHAQELIAAGAVTVDGRAVSKPSLDVSDSADIVVTGDAARYVSRAAHKLVGALERCMPLGLTVQGTYALDAGASTGGFTQVLLEHGAAHVRAVDVGHDQLAPSVREDPHVTHVEGLNVRYLSADDEGAGVALVVSDLSFISLPIVIPALVDFAAADADFLLMVKPQFELGRRALTGRGVVADPRDRARAVTGVAAAMEASGLVIHEVARSALPGPEGNVEFFVWGSGAWQARGQQPDRSGRPVLTGGALSDRIEEEALAV